MMRKNSKQTQTFVEEAGPSSKPDLHARSDSPRSLDRESPSSRPRSLSPRDQEDAGQASQQKPGRAIPAQSNARSPSETTPAQSVPSSRQNSAEKARRIRKEQIRHQIRRTLDIISMVCWGDLEPALAMLRRSYLRALDRIDRGDQGVPLFRLSDRDSRLSDGSHTFAEDYRDWVLPLGPYYPAARSERRGHQPGGYPGGMGVTIDGRDLNFDDEAMVVRVHGARSTWQPEARHSSHSDAGQSQPRRPRRPRRPTRKRPNLTQRGEGTHLSQSLRDSSKQTKAESSSSTPSKRAAQNPSPPHVDTTAPSRATRRARATSSPGRTTISNPGPMSPHHTARYRREWEDFHRREANNLEIPRERRPRHGRRNATTSSPSPLPSLPDDQVPDTGLRTPRLPMHSAAMLYGPSRHHCLGPLALRDDGTLRGLDPSHGNGLCMLGCEDGEVME